MSKNSLNSPTNKNTKKVIGIFDSGHGGLELLQYLATCHNDWTFHYVADILEMPYGTKAQDIIEKRCFEIITWFTELGCDAVVIACNTATAMAIDKLREQFEIPIVGIEPYLNYINKAPEKDFHNQRLGALVTPNTFESKRFKRLKEKLDPQNLVAVEPMLTLASLVEGLIENKNLEVFIAQLNNLMTPLSKHKWKEVILGCTHYPLISEFIGRSLQVKCISPTQYVAAQLQKRLDMQPIELCEDSSLISYKDASFQYLNTAQGSWETKKISDFLFWRYS